MRKLIQMLAFGLFLFLGLSATAQQQTISGIVSDGADKSPLPNVTVKVKETKVGTTTNSAGYFTIKASAGQTLVFSFVGYGTLERKVGSATTMNIDMVNDEKKLGEVVVTALNIRRNKNSIGYSTTDVKGSELAQTNRENIFTSLAGRAPGVTVTPTSGAVGASTQIVLRGFNSVGLSNQPLIVVDGVPFNNETFNQGSLVSDLPNRNQDYTNRGADINPEDIENMTILRGPEAAALYGVLGANGAILITTKKGKTGKGRITYDFNTRFDVVNVNRLPKIQRVFDQGTNGVFDITTRNTFGPRYAEGTQFFDNTKNFFQTGRVDRHNLSIEGGADKTSFRFSGQYINQDGTVPTTNFKRLNLRVNTSTKLHNKIDVNTSFAYFNSVTNKPTRGDGGLLLSLLQWPVDDDVRNFLNSDGSKRNIQPNQFASEIDNPYFELNFNRNQDRSNRFTGALNIVADATEWLQLTARVGVDFSADQGNTFISPFSFASVSSGAGLGRGRIENYMNNNLLLNYQFMASATKTFGGFKTTLRVGTALDDTKRFTSSQRGDSLFIPDFNSLDNTNPTFQRLRQRNQLRRIMGVFSEFSLAYKDLMFVSVAGRNDWASPLPEQNRSFFYPTASMSFVVSNIKGFKEATSTWLSLFRLRASLARTNRFPTPYQNQAAFLSQLTSGGGYAFDFFAPNPDLKPEKQSTYELGFEARFANGRLGIDFAYYNTIVKDQIGQLLRLSYGSGFVLNTQNFTDTRNWGTEIQLTAIPVKTKNVTWNTTFNFNRMRNRVERMPANLPEFYVSDTWITNSRGSMFPGNTTTAIGGQTYRKNNAGQIIIDPTTGLPLLGVAYEKTGERLPNFTVGWNNTITIKSITLSVLFDIRRGGDIFNVNELFLTRRGLSQRTVDRETPRIFPGVLNDANVNSATPTPNTISVTPMYRQAYWSAIAEDEFIERGINWFRLRDVTIGYNIPKKLFSKFGFISALNVYATGTDLFLITNYSGVDPLTNSNTPATPGVGGFGFDFGTVPLPRTFLFGIRASF
ncbi:MAG: SusC/RagA family TonB-linked outer membrane protein [Chitinophagaceae bacterium]|jgi:TonB-linked SusC/RagA family outer membrane protein